MDPLDRFEFSQSNLQDYVDCPRRFQLRYVQHVAWPAIQAEPARENERQMQRGDRFHRLVQQFLLMLPVEKLNRLAEADEDKNLLLWWQNFLDCIPDDLNGTRHVEVALEAPLSQFRLVAKYDLVLIRHAGNVVIYDWKTSVHRPQRNWLDARLQTRVYPYLLTRAGMALNNGCPVEPEQVEMIYWYADPTQPPEPFAYTRQRYQEDEQYLLALAGEIRSTQTFCQVLSDKTCKYCVYRSLCNRGTSAGEIDDLAGYQPEEGGSLDFNLEQIGEVSF